MLAIGVGLAVVNATGLCAPMLSAVQRILALRDPLAAVLFLGLGVHTFLRRGPLWGCLVLFPVLQGLASGSTMSMTRIVLCSYPAFLSAAELTANRALFAVTVAVCLWAQVILLALHVNGAFVA